MSLDSTLCVSASEIWVQSTRRAWREEQPPECIGTARLALREIMPIDYMPTREVALPPSITRATVAPNRSRLQALIDAEQVCEMLSGAARAMERTAPNDTLALADRTWFGADSPVSVGSGCLGADRRTAGSMGDGARVRTLGSGKINSRDRYR